ncbi:hypothetical protein SAMN00017405_0723 [Desulfonispora thiosulfatigenes DSM 11270]|uniref:Uncharacterized protein n=1 Tax=Desulfonispora thiosulfatigenes DSM 11270 TaxID=656914 RepID=A0A1W1UDF8_DESTI|nr:hypothetical protein SAMN00017405_0723 [Desulfonispora thiosulfatigenes DSM 11270]
MAKKSQPDSKEARVKKGNCQNPLVREAQKYNNNSQK